ncbi:MAG: malectin domain-containing carbohydrate-binding protein, partial [Rhodothermales bacterium]|nr:malectin domain-containing carbohydrate-binding protein [Rhodothermales bacterium]
RSERWGTFAYAAPVPNGTYEVTLRFAEVYFTANGKRVFGVKAEGKNIVSALDLHAEVGHDAAYDVTRTVEVTDGTLNLAFAASTNKAKLAGFLVRSVGDTGDGGGSGDGDPPGDGGGGGTPEPGAVVLAVNAGGPAFTAADGVSYAADAGFAGGNTYTTPDAISGTADDALYRSERWGTFAYAAPVPNGTYEVTLRFAEVYWTADGRRVLTVEAEGQPVVSALDVHAVAGHDAAHDVTAVVEVADGTLDLAFSASKDKAKLAALVVRAMAAARGAGGAAATEGETAEGPAANASAGTPEARPLEVYPNPAAAAATFEYGLAESVPVRLELYDGLGRRVAVLVDATQEAGTHRVRFDRAALASGVYHWRLRAGDRTESGRLTLAR